MTNTTHSPTPWKASIEHSGSGDFETRVEDKNSQLVCDLWDNGNNHCDARRIVDCVNALEGLSSDALDGGWNFREMSDYAKKLEAENAELKKELDEIRKHIENFGEWVKSKGSFPNQEIELPLAGVPYYNKTTSQPPIYASALNIIGALEAQGYKVKDAAIKN